jgi:hypothetical protein
MPMPNVPAIYSGPNGIRQAASGTVMTVYTIAVVGNRREDFQRRPLQLLGWNRHSRTQTYNEGGRLVESTAPPTLDIRM